MSRPFIVSAALALALVQLPLAARAQPGAETLARAKIHFEAGTRHYDIGAYDDAAREFERAYELSEHPELLYNIYSSLERAGRYAEAADALSSYLELGEIADSQRPSLEARLASLRARGASPERPADEATEPGPEAAAETDGGEAGDGLPTLALASYTAAGGMAAVFGTFAGLALAEDRSLDDRCGGGCAPGDVKKLRALNITADVALAAGVAALTTALVSTFVGRGDAPKVDVSFFADRDARGVMFGGRF